MTLRTPQSLAPQTADGARSSWLPAALSVGLFLITMAVYWPVLGCGFVNFDDPDYVAANAHVLGGLTPGNVGWALTTGYIGNWHPLTWLSLMLDATCWGKGPAGFHATNLLLHGLNALLLFWLLRELTGATWRSAWVAAAFAWHPLHVESVAWISERKDVLSTAFGWLALLGHVRYTRSDGRQAQAYYWATWFFLALGLLSKPMLVTLPCVFALLDYWPLNRWRPGRWPALLIEKGPFFVLGVVFCVITWQVQAAGGAMNELIRLTWSMRVENTFVAYERYLGKLAWPVDLAVIYPYPSSWPFGRVLAAVALLAGISGLAWTQRRRSPFLLVGWAWFLGTLVPVIGLVQVGRQSLADRYTYIPSVGIFILLGWGAAELARRWAPGRLWLGFAGSMGLVACLAGTRQQLNYWSNSEVLFRHALVVTGPNFTAYNDLGTELDRQGRTGEAVAAFESALALEPGNAHTHYNYGNALARQGKTDAAIHEYQTASQLDPDYADPHNNLGVALNNLGQTDAAIAEFQVALRIQPEDGGAHYNLGNALLKHGQLAGALTNFMAAVRLQPEFAPGHYNLGAVLVEAGRLDEAIAQFQTALDLKPDYALAHNHLGMALAERGKLGEAIVEFQTALRLKPDYASAQKNLAQALARQAHPAP